MSEKKMSRKEALEHAIKFITDECDAAGVWEDSDCEAIEVLTKMHEQVSKSRKKPEGPSKARRDNERLAREVAEAIAAKGEPVTGK